jgi:hypothetical protein
MPDRLEELRRQRGLVQQHLDWLDREIIAETEKIDQAKAGARIAAVVATAVPKTSSPPATASAIPTATPARPLAPEATADPDAIIDKYRVAPTALHNDVRKGCLLYFAAALALFIGGVIILYFVLSRR